MQPFFIRLKSPVALEELRENRSKKKGEREREREREREEREREREIERDRERERPWRVHHKQEVKLPSPASEICT